MEVEWYSTTMRQINFLIFILVFSCVIPVPALAFEKIFYFNNSKAGLESLKKNADKIDILAPQSYSVSAKMVPSGSLSKEVKKIAADYNIQIMPLIVNSGFNKEVMHKLLITPSAQQAVIAYMVLTALREKYIGWQFDFEHIAHTDRDLYSEFAEKTATEFKKHGLILSIAAVARKNDEVTEAYKNWGGVYDYERLVKSVDFISIMTYDDPDSKKSTASIPYLHEVYTYLKDKIPPAKLSLGIPFYYWQWSVEESPKRSTGVHSKIATIKSLYPNAIEGFDTTLRVPWLAYIKNGIPYIVWHENTESFMEKINFAKKYNLRGYSAWVLGAEHPDMWMTADL